MSREQVQSTSARSLCVSNQVMVVPPQFHPPRMQVYRELGLVRLSAPPLFIGWKGPPCFLNIQRFPLHVFPALTQIPHHKKSRAAILPPAPEPIFVPPAAKFPPPDENDLKRFYSNKVLLCGLPFEMNENQIVEKFKEFELCAIDWMLAKDWLDYEHDNKTKTVHLVLKSGEGVKALLRKCGYNRENEEFYFIACKRPGEPLIQIIPWSSHDHYWLGNGVYDMANKNVARIYAPPGMICAKKLSACVSQEFGEVGCCVLRTEKERSDYPVGTGFLVFAETSNCKEALAAGSITFRTQLYTIAVLMREHSQNLASS